MGTETTQEGRRDPGEETTHPRGDGEDRPTMEGCCCGGMSKEMKAVCMSMMGRGCFPAEPRKATTE